MHITLLILTIAVSTITAVFLVARRGKESGDALIVAIVGLIVAAITIITLCNTTGWR